MTRPSSSAEARTLYRILDANANRSLEGLRVIEEAARFALDEADLTAALKRLRHDLTAQLTRLARPDRMSARDTAGDVGTAIATEAERRRTGLIDVVAANAQRVKEALRCLEEYGKPLDGDFASATERLRYRFYDLEAALLTALERSAPPAARSLEQPQSHSADGEPVEGAVSTDRADTARGGTDATVRAERLARLEAARLYLLTDGGPDERGFVARLTALCEAGLPIVQLRDKLLDDRTLFQRAERLRRITEATGTLLIINDRADVAEAVDADGVHIGQEELPIEAVRRVVGGRLVGLSTHDGDQLADAIGRGADYVGLGPTFSSRTKSFTAFAGLEFLRLAAAWGRGEPPVNERLDIGPLNIGRRPIGRRTPMYAIGGIELHHIPQVVATGIDRVAVGQAITAADDGPQAVRLFLDALASASVGGARAAATLRESSAAQAAFNGTASRPATIGSIRPEDASDGESG